MFPTVCCSRSTTGSTCVTLARCASIVKPYRHSVSRCSTKETWFAICGRNYSRVLEELEARRLELEGKSSQEYLDKMRVGLTNWVEAADNGHSRVGHPTFPKTRLTPICQLPTAAIDSTAGRRRYR
ncbi:Putative methyltransferase/methylase (part2) [Mycobacterium canettii CIPT 140070008]|nr:Putative methyltransferase/methylase (part2) [Mycobacterium canettii CIPT 140070008]